MCVLYVHVSSTELWLESTQFGWVEPTRVSCHQHCSSAGPVIWTRVAVKLWTLDLSVVSFARCINAFLYLVEIKCIACSSTYVVLFHLFALYMNVSFVIITMRLFVFRRQLRQRTTRSRSSTVRSCLRVSRLLPWLHSRRCQCLLVCWQNSRLTMCSNMSFPWRCDKLFPAYYILHKTCIQVHSQLIWLP